MKINTNNKESKGLEKVEKKKMSDSEIREKIATKKESDISAIVALKSQKKLGEGFMKEVPEKNSEEILKDVSLNNPNDSNTQEKLKSALRTGAFNFNDREREALTKILQ